MKICEITIKDFDNEKLVENNKNKKTFMVIGPVNGLVAINKDNLSDFLNESDRFSVLDENLSPFWGSEFFAFFNDTGRFQAGSSKNGISTQFRYNTFKIHHLISLTCEVEKIIHEFVKREKYTFEIRTWS